jgi:hypothetical protein
MPYPTVVAGHHLVLYVNGSIFGLVTNMQWSVDAEWRPEQVIDYAGPIEFMPGSTRVRGSFGIVRARANGSLEAMGMTTYARNLLKQKYLHFQVRDRITGNVFYEATNVVVLNQTWQTGPRQLVQGTFTWEGMGWTNSDDDDGAQQ